MDTVQKINNTLVSLFNTVLKMEEKALKESSIHNLSIKEIHTLVAIGKGRPKTMTQVAGILKVSVSTLTVAINKLVGKGYVNRFRVPEDRRIVKIELTEQGIAVVKQHEEFHMEMIRDAIAGLSKEEADRFAAAIDNVDKFMLMERVTEVKHDGPFELKPMHLGNLMIPVPLFQGGMGIGISMGRLASAVVKCGGVGVIAAAQIGFAEPDFKSNERNANQSALRREIKKAVDAKSDVKNPGPVGVNVMVSSEQYEVSVQTAIEAGADIIISSAGIPTSLPGICKGSNVKLIPIVSSARAAGVIIRNWAKKYNRTPDAIIFEGPLAGGYLGFKEEKLEAAEEEFYKTIKDIKVKLTDLQSCPLIVAGGIYTKADAQKVLACGADGIQMGTRFVTTEECDAPDCFKEAYLKAGEQDLAIIKSPEGLPGRAINNTFVKTIAKHEIPIQDCNNCLNTCNPKEAKYCITQALVNAAKGDLENGLIFCGSQVVKSNKIETVADVFSEFV